MTCGTIGGYNGHRYHREAPCDECRQAKREYESAKRESAPPCSIAGCNAKQQAKGMCSRHYGKQRRNGDPLIDGRDPERNFWERVHVGPAPAYAPHLGECWQWSGKTTTKGYGVFRTAQRYVHRYVYELMVAPIPDGLTIDHLCRVRNCVNPAHLDPVPRHENTRRQMAARLEENRA